MRKKNQGLEYAHQDAGTGPAATKDARKASCCYTCTALHVACLFSCHRPRPARNTTRMPRNTNAEREPWCVCVCLPRCRSQPLQPSQPFQPFQPYQTADRRRGHHDSCRDKNPGVQSGSCCLHWWPAATHTLGRWDGRTNGGPGRSSRKPSSYYLCAELRRVGARVSSLLAGTD